MKEFYLKDLLQIKNGKDHKHLSNGSIPVFGSGGVIRYGNQALYQEESILLPRKGTLSNIQFSRVPFWTVDTIYYTEIKNAITNPYYLYNYLRTLNLENLNSGTGVPSMTFDSYYGIKVKLPRIEIQNKISHVLSSIENKIKLNDTINDNLSHIYFTLTWPFINIGNSQSRRDANC